MIRLWMALLTFIGSQALASDLDEFKVKRQEVFEFTGKPVVVREGDRITIAFGSKANCDATVAIEDAQRRIIRHLASGVLGPNAPEPFQKNSLKQTVVWDGKDDKGEYVDDKDGLTVRVSLGLRPQFERTLLWDPRRRLSAAGSQGGDTYPAPIMAATRDGVYVYDGGGTALDHVRLYDHDGNYVRTVYPFPADKVRQVKGLTWHRYPQDGLELPLKSTFLQNTFLTAGNNYVPTYNPKTGVFHTNGGKEMAHFGMWGHAASAMAVRDLPGRDGAGRIALAQLRLNRLATDGTSGGMELNGPKVCQRVVLGMTYAGPGGPYDARPRSAALSPDGKWVYLTGYLWHASLNFDGLHGVMRAPMDGDGAAQVFVGSMDVKGGGDDDAHLRYALSVACDGAGRVYVADYMNDRIQVFDSDRKLLKTIRSAKPVHIEVDAKTGEIYVFSWQMTTRMLMVQAGEADKRQEKLRIPATLTIYRSFDDPQATKRYAIPFEDYRADVSSYYASHEGMRYRVCLDPWTTPATIWMVPTVTGPGGDNRAGRPTGALRLLVPKDGKLVVKRDFGTEAEQWPPPANGRQRLFVNPVTHKLYVANCGGVEFGELLEVDPASGRSRACKLPLSAEDMAFGQDGSVYLRTYRELVRYAPGEWREVPFDYGEERLIGSAGKQVPLISAVPLPSVGGWFQGGMSVSPRGRIAVGCNYAAKNEGRKDEPVVGNPKGAWQPRLYRGRSTMWVYGSIYVHVWDEHGKVVHEDAVQGLRGTHGVGIDNADNIYLLVNASRVLDGKPYFNDATGTLMKFKSGHGRIICNAGAPVPLEEPPNRNPDLQTLPGPGWVEGAEWMYGGIGWDGKKWVGCCCWNSRFFLDYFGRSFAPETDRFRVAVLDAAGNLILRVGQYGNVDDGRPTDPAGGPAGARSLGGDEVALMHGAYVTSDTDRRLFVADPGNARVLSVKLGYHAEQRIPLRDVRDRSQK